MSLLIAGLIAEDLNSVIAADRHHATLGEFFDGGSVALINGVSPQPGGFEQITASEFQSAAQAAGIHLGYSSLAEAVAEDTQIQIVNKLTALSDAAQLIEPWWLHLSSGGVLSLLLFDQTTPACLVVMFGHGLPSMGTLSDCRLQDVWATWFVLAGGLPHTGSFLLQEPVSGVSARDEEALLTRLRQLYGDG